MQVIVTSDTHYHREWRRTLETFVDEIAVLCLDCLVVAGDVGEGIAGFREMLRLLQKVDCPRLILTGNHDLWSRDGVSTEELWTEVLPRLTRESGAIWLEGENWSREGIAICGTNGWYDYSAGDPSIPMTVEDYVAFKGQVMADAEFMNWFRTDIEFANQLGEAFSARLSVLEADPSIREILVVTHVPPFEEGLVHKSGDRAWNMTNAYFGNLTLGRRICASHKVTRVVSGHAHIGKTVTISRAWGNIDMRVIPADYGKPAYLSFEYVSGV